jgi:hypothetical protein
LPNQTLPNITGSWRGHPNYPSMLKSEEGHALEERIKQLGGGAFLQAFESLKGGGAIQEQEGAKATAALARLANLQQGEKGFREALKEFRDEVIALRQLAHDRASGKLPMPPAPTAVAPPAPAPAATAAPPPSSAPAGPSVGEVRRGYRFKGGDPAEPGSWEKVTP